MQSRQKLVATYSKHLKQSLLWHNNPLELLLLLDCHLGDLLESGVVRVSNWSGLRVNTEVATLANQDKTYLSSIAIS